ncbi:hypothetical protein HDU86_005082 [Geranomyces michiganensis]|nr:hypothetical protein HDU86_005082 [Geranomyces michiganensis]
MHGTKNGVVVTLTEPWGYFWTHDHRGEYSADADCTVLIQPVDSQLNPATHITIDIFGVETEGCCDSADVYEGSTIDDQTLVASVNGSRSAVISVNGPSALFHFFSDGTVNRDGIAGFYYITAEAANIPYGSLKCPMNCFEQGTCINGRCVCHAGYSGVLCKNDDLVKLFALYDNCIYTDWAAAKWNRSLDINMCELPPSKAWAGVICSSNRVRELDLSGVQLDCHGKGLPSTTALRYTDMINLSDSQITGPIPAEFWRGYYLNQVILRNAQLSGMIGEGIGSAPSLNLLDLSHNNLTGPVPIALSRLLLLNEVDLSHNQLSGYIPEELGNLPLAKISLVANNFYCPIPDLDQIVDVSCNNLTLVTISPESAISGATGQTVTVTGHGFSFSPDTLSCTFGGVESENTTIISDTKLECTVPQRIAGPTQFEIYAFGSPASHNSLDFQFVPNCVYGTYLNAANRSTCAVCPAHAICEGGPHQPYPESGYHRSLKDPNIYLQCFLEDSCPSKKSGECKTGFTGSRCSSCIEGHYLISGDCVTCTGVDTVKPVIFIALAAVGLTGLGLWMALTALNFASTNLLLMFVQVGGLLLDIPLKWHSMVTGFGSSFSAVNIDLRQLGLACALNLDFSQLMTFILATPLVMLGLLTTALAMWFFWATKYRKPRLQRSWALKIAGAALSNALLALLILAHIPLSEKFVYTFECATDIDRSYVAADPEVTCYESLWEDSKHKAIAGCILYAAGIPVVTAGICWHNRRQMNDDMVVRQVGVLFDLYIDSAWWFEAYRCCYNLLLMCIPVAMADYPLFIASFCIVVINFDGWLVARIRPYRFPHANNVYPFVVLSLTVTCFSGILFFTETLTDQQSEGVSSLTACVIGATIIILVHSLVYEWQLLHWANLRRIPWLGQFFYTKPWGIVFPVHLTQQGRELTRKIEKLPDVSTSWPTNAYPPQWYETAFVKPHMSVPQDEGHGTCGRAGPSSNAGGGKGKAITHEDVIVEVVRTSEFDKGDTDIRKRGHTEMEEGRTP